MDEQNMTNTENLEAQEEEDFGLFELEDEDGNMLLMRLVTVLSHGDDQYAAMVSEDVYQSDSEEADVVFMRVVDENAQDPNAWLSPVEDDALLDTLFADFLAFMEEVEEEEDDEDEDQDTE